MLAIHGLPVARGIALRPRACWWRPARVDVAYFIEVPQIP